MAVIQPIIRVEIVPSKPVQEILSVISAVAAFHPGREKEVLEGVKLALEKRLEEINK